MKTTEINLYKFNELSEEAKSYAIKNEQEYQMENGQLLQFFNEQVEEQAKEKGFEGFKNLQYSLSYSQGDGLSFAFDKYAGLKDLFIKHLGANKARTAQLLADNCPLKATGNKGHYYYASKSDIDLYIENYTSAINTDCANINKVVDKVLADLQDIYVDTCKEFEKQGYNEIEYLTGEECAKENILANDYDFTANGHIY
jgi:hypothetical protein